MNKDITRKSLDHPKHINEQEIENEASPHFLFDCRAVHLKSSKPCKSKSHLTFKSKAFQSRRAHNLFLLTLQEYHGLILRFSPNFHCFILYCSHLDKLLMASSLLPLLRSQEGLSGMRTRRRIGRIGIRAPGKVVRRHGRPQPRMYISRLPAGLI